VSGDKASTSLAEFEEQKSVASLQSLLEANGFESPGLMSLGAFTSSVAFMSRVSDGQPEDFRECVVVDAVRLQTPTGELIVAVGRFQATGYPPGECTEIAFVFDTDGRLLRHFGRFATLENPQRTTIGVRTLGSRNDWFVIVSSAHRRDPSTSPFERSTSVFLLSHEFRQVLEVEHYFNDMGYTQTPAEAAKLKFVALLFRGRPEWGDAVHVDLRATGRGPQSRIEWDESNKRFLGAIELEAGGHPLFKVDLSKSDGFKVR